jgi:hypothetical protein
VKHIAPPITSESTDAEQRLDHPELVGDLGATEHRHERPLRVLTQAEQHLDLLPRSRPIADGNVCGGPTIEACARCDAPNASLT